MSERIPLSEIRLVIYNYSNELGKKGNVKKIYIDNGIDGFLNNLRSQVIFIFFYFQLKKVL